MIEIVRLSLHFDRFRRGTRVRSPALGLYKKTARALKRLGQPTQLVTYSLCELARGVCSAVWNIVTQ